MVLKAEKYDGSLRGFMYVTEDFAASKKDDGQENQDCGHPNRPDPNGRGRGIAGGQDGRRGKTYYSLGDTINDNQRLDIAVMRKGYG